MARRKVKNGGFFPSVLYTFLRPDYLPLGIRGLNNVLRMSVTFAFTECLPSVYRVVLLNREVLGKRSLFGKTRTRRAEYY